MNIAFRLGRVRPPIKSYALTVLRHYARGHPGIEFLVGLAETVFGAAAISVNVAYVRGTELRRRS